MSQRRLPFGRMQLEAERNKLLYEAHNGSLSKRECTMTDPNAPRQSTMQPTMADPTSRNVQNMLNFMNDPCRSPTGSDVATMDDAQFTASLDALLEMGGSRSAVPAFGDRTMDHAPQTTESNLPEFSLIVLAEGRSDGKSHSALNNGSHKAFRGVGELFILPPPPAVMFPAQKPTAGAPLGPSPLTSRLAFNYSAGPMLSRPMSAIAPSPAPSTVSSLSTTTQQVPPNTAASHKRPHSAFEISEDEGENAKRRLDRNSREQQRSHRISDQIGQLKEVLSQANVQFKPDKYSTLVGVVEYIKELQARSAMLDGEHKKLLTTIEKTSEVANSAYFQASTTSGMSTTQVSIDTMSEEGACTTVMEDDYAVFVEGLDYKSVFGQNIVALAVASIDGRFLDCNAEFEQLAGLPREELLPGEARAKMLNPDGPPSATVEATAPHRNLSLFSLLTRDDMERVFLAMSQMIKNRNTQGETRPTLPTTSDFWTGIVKQTTDQQQKLTMIVSLVRSPRGRPKFFNVALTPAA